jgi:hypothetical protein
VSAGLPPQDIYRTHCMACGARFTDANVYTEAGWIETQISGICEACYDAVADLFLMTKDGNDDGRTEEPPSGG